MELREIVDQMRALGIKRFTPRPGWFDGDPLNDYIKGEIELFDTIPAPAPTERPPAEGIDLAEALGLEPGTEVKEAGVCCVRGCSNESGGAMAGRIAPEMCRDHALQMGGSR